MSEEAIVAEQQEVQEVDYKSLYEKAQDDLQKVAAKKDELLKETKKAKADREEATIAAVKAEQEKAVKDGEFEKLWQTAKQEKEELMQKLNNIATQNRQEKIQVAAMRLANDLADGDNAELLSDFVARDLSKIADETGALSADVLEAIKNDFKANKKFGALLRSSKAAGGGAAGNLSTSQASSKIIDRTAFGRLNPAQQMAHVKSGGTVVDSL